MANMLNHRRRDDDEDLAYGRDYGQSRGYGDQGGSGRSLVGDVLNKVKTKVDKYGRPQQSDPYGYGSSGGQQQQYSQSTTQPYNQPVVQGISPSGYQGSTQSQYQNTSHSQFQNPIQSQNQPAYVGGPPPQPQKPQQKQDIAGKIFSGLHGTIHSIGSDVAGLLGTKYEPHHQAYTSNQSTSGQPATQGVTRNRFDSSFSEKHGNDTKYYVDGCSYMWAVSEALERARESVWILDWWLSPELYLRRPPAANEEWRIDRVLKRIADRGVKINIIVYKEVTQALTLSSSHTKHALEDLSPNIGVFRHPDHLPDAQTAQSSILSSLQGLKLDAAGASKLGADALKGIYGLSGGVILYWAHHEKLCVIDGEIAFMGGLDLCYGRWDTNNHSISDVHPSDLNKIVFPGQDYNNARVSDFDDVAHPFQNKLDRTKSSRMGWSDVSICLRGPCVQDLRQHFIDRWNFIYDEKYNVRKDVRYTRIPLLGSQISGQAPSGNAPSGGQQSLPAGQYPPPPGSQPYTQPPWQATSGVHIAASTGQYGSRPHSPQPPAGQYSTDQHQYGDRPHNSQPPVGQYNAGQQQTYFPPPPPRPPPQISHPSYSGQEQYQSSQPTQQQYDSGYQTHVPVSSELHQPIPQQQHSSSYQPSLGQSQAQYTTGHDGPQTQTMYNSGYQQQPLPASQPPQPAHPEYPSGYQSPSNPQQTHPGEYGNTYNTQVQELPASPPTHQQYQPSATMRGFDQYEATGTSRGLDDEYASGDTPRGFGENPDYYGSGQDHTRGPSSKGRFDQYRTEGRKLGSELGSIGNLIQHRVEDKVYGGAGKVFGSSISRPQSRSGGAMRCQLIRSCTKWSNGTPTEHSIQNAYIDVIMNSQHFIYIENQFFITATGDKQGPVKNQIGKALVDRILRAARNGERYHVIVIMPAIPAFAGDFVDDQSLGTRAICEFQYFSICRGGNSIMEKIAQAGFNPMDYIRFYNLRNYDRINYTASMMQAQSQSGIGYEDARKQQEQTLGAGYAGQGYQGYGQPGQHAYAGNPAQQYQGAAQAAQTHTADRWDSVASCYMLHGEDIRTVPWSGPPEAELDAFVSEQLYVHTKVMIADDRVVICGSANLNDRSMLGYHDSEIALFINDPTPLQSSMAGRPYQASRFAASLRRQLFRKHLGLLPPQNMSRPDDNFLPLGPPNLYDWDSPEDRIVSDPLSNTFLALWNTRARTNTEVFRKAFRAVPDDFVRTWPEYKEFFEYYFRKGNAATSGKDKGVKTPARVEYGHVVRDDFPGGAKELKELLSKVKGTLVEMPLCFLQDEDIAKEGLSLNALTEDVYT